MGSLNSNQYNSVVSTFVTAPIVSKAWADFTNPVVLGTDSLALDDADFNNDTVVFSRIGALGRESFVFNRFDRTRILDVTLKCNFADGLVLNNTVSQTSGFDTVGDNVIVSTPNIQGIFGIMFDAKRVTYEGKTFGVGTTMYPIYGFEQRFELNEWEPRGLASDTLNYGPQFDAPNQAIDLGWILAARLILDPLVPPTFSTVSIDPLHQSDKVTIWIELTLEHSFDMVNYISPN